MKIIIGIAAHKPYWMPEDAVYMPLYVGAAEHETPASDWQRDDTGDAISKKNATFCELTGHYWLWKNAQADAYGLCHYRRYFGKRWGSKKHRILSGEALLRMLDNCDVLLPKKRHYWIETNEMQYIHAHHAEDLRLTKCILEERYPAYVPDWDVVMRRRSGHRFNMFVMRRGPFEAYSAWLFEILFELEKRLDLSNYSTQDRRVFGYVAERLLDVWLNHQTLTVRECPVVNLENQHWGRKILCFVWRKIRLANE